jgi:homoserine dehydrogenase
MNIALLGCGTVGAAVAGLLVNEKNLILRRSNAQINLKYIFDINFDYARKKGLPESLFCNNFDIIISDKTVDTVIELVGGIDIAKTFIQKSLDSKKNVVTANKALMAQFGTELLSLARKNNTSLAFEASCGGGIPIIRALTEGLLANDIHALYGILNGTCNYILTSMTIEGKTYNQALKEARKKGYAEADPYLDVSGIDTAHKLAILAALAFGQKIDFNRIPISGINDLHELDVSYGQELGYVIKLLAIAKKQEKGLSLCTRPAFISKEHPLAWVSGPFNAVSVYGNTTGHTMYYGRGAGGRPTASAILADLYSIAINSYSKTFNSFLWPDLAPTSKQLPVEEIYTRYYMRITAKDAPGVLAKISACLGNKNISISSVLQKEPPPGTDPKFGVPVVITTHKAIEGNLRDALKEIDELDVVKDKSICIEIVEEDEEKII